MEFGFHETIHIKNLLVLPINHPLNAEPGLAMEWTLKGLQKKKNIKKWMVSKNYKYFYQVYYWTCTSCGDMLWDINAMHEYNRINHSTSLLSQSEHDGILDQYVSYGLGEYRLHNVQGILKLLIKSLIFKLTLSN